MELKTAFTSNILNINSVFSFGFNYESIEKPGFLREMYQKSFDESVEFAIRLGRWNPITSDIIDLLTFGYSNKGKHIIWYQHYEVMGIKTQTFSNMLDLPKIWSKLIHQEYKVPTIKSTSKEQVLQKEVRELKTMVVRMMEMLSNKT